MGTLIDRLSKLSPEQRLLLERKLKDKQAAEPRQPAMASEPPWLQGDLLAVRLSWWREHLAARPVRRLSVPGRRRDGAGRGREPVSLPAVPVSTLRATAGAWSVELETLLLAAFGALLGRYCGRQRLAVGHAFSTGAAWVNVLPVEVDLTGDPAVPDLFGRVADAVARAGSHADIPFRQLARELAKAGDLRPGETLLPVALRLRSGGAGALSWPQGPEAPGHELLLDIEVGDVLAGELAYDSGAFDRAVAEGLALHLPELLAALTVSPETPLSGLPLHGEALKRRFSRSSVPVAEAAITVQALFAARIAQDPDAVALSVDGRTVTAREIGECARRVAQGLRRRGLAVEDRVALRLEPSPDLVATLLGVLAAGAAVVVLDPEEGAASLAEAVAEVRPRWLIADGADEEVARSLGVACLGLDAVHAAVDADRGEPVPPVGDAASVAAAILVLDPPGGRRWALLTHGALVRLFTALDRVAGCGPGDALPVLSPLGSAGWLVELLWPLTRGAQAVLPRLEEEPIPRRLPRTAAEKRIGISLFYFGSQESGSGGGHRLVFEGARFADRHGFEAVWTPERHFHPFGALFPNAAVNAAALAMITERVHLRAGSVVLPLHHPVRVAEEWALADNLSQGRVGIAFASGWHSNDFVFAPDTYADRREVMFREIETVRRLWRGEPVTYRGGSGQEVPVRIFPKPVQRELPVWITVAATPGTCGRAGEIGANILTHLLGQGLERVQERIRHYREARARSGYDPQSGRVTLMLHTFLGSDLGVVRDTVRRPFSEYIRSFTGLLDSLAKSQNLGIGREAMSEDDVESLLAFAFERYFSDSGLFGTPRSAMEMIRRLQEIGVDEVACLIDFGVEPEAVLAGLYYLDRLRELANQHSAPPVPAAVPGAPLPPATLAHCSSPRTAAELAGAAVCLHGTPESGIWSVRVEPRPGADDPPAVLPLDGAEVFVLDARLDLAPVGAEGELCVGGNGLARGYLERADLTAARFVPSPLGPAGSRLLRTGQRARYRADGTVEWLGLASGGQVRP